MSDITDALSMLDPALDDHWTSDGLPRMDVMCDLVGKTITRQEVTDAAPLFTRDAPAVGELRPGSEPTLDELEEMDWEKLSVMEPLVSRYSVLVSEEIGKYRSMKKELEDKESALTAKHDKAVEALELLNHQDAGHLINDYVDAQAKLRHEAQVKKDRVAKFLELLGTQAEEQGRMDLSEKVLGSLGKA